MGYTTGGPVYAAGVLSGDGAVLYVGSFDGSTYALDATASFVPVGGRCPADCEGKMPYCECQLSGSGNARIGTIGNRSTGIIQIVALFGGATATGLAGVPPEIHDCSSVPGCGKSNCNECINQYWVPETKSCVPGCINKEYER